MNKINIPSDMIAGTIHKTNNFGDLEIVGYKRASEVVIKFCKTNHKKIVRAGTIREGVVKDPFYPSVVGVGYIGLG